MNTSSKMPTCRSCKQEKPFTDFYEDFNNKCGIKTTCKECYNLKRRPVDTPPNQELQELGSRISETVTQLNIALKLKASKEKTSPIISEYVDLIISQATLMKKKIKGCRPKGQIGLPRSNMIDTDINMAMLRIKSEMQFFLLEKNIVTTIDTFQEGEEVVITTGQIVPDEDINEFLISRKVVQDFVYSSD